MSLALPINAFKIYSNIDLARGDAIYPHSRTFQGSDLAKTVSTHKLECESRL